MPLSDNDALTPDEQAALAARTADADAGETDFEPVFSALFPDPLGHTEEAAIVAALAAAAVLAEEATAQRQTSALAVVVRRDGSGGVSVQIGVEVSGVNRSFVVINAAQSPPPQASAVAPPIEG